MPWWFTRRRKWAAGCCGRRISITARCFAVSRSGIPSIPPERLASRLRQIDLLLLPLARLAAAPRTLGRQAEMEIEQLLEEIASLTRAIVERDRFLADEQRRIGQA